MIHRPVDRKPGNRVVRSGSALLLTLLVVSLLMVIVLGFTMLIRLELRMVRNDQDRRQAGANARLGVELAVARLQELAGPDARVTASASLLDADPDTAAIDGVPHPHWAGVWRKTDPGSRAHDPEFLGWLVSRSDPAAPNAPLDPARSAILVGPGSVNHPEDEVEAETLELRQPDGDVRGRLAWWAGDEGVKASFGLEDPYRESADFPESRWTQSLAQRQGVEVIPGLDAQSGGEPVLTARADLLERVPGRGTLALLHPDFQEAAADTFHEVAPLSLGVLADSRNGGLKRDLTLPFELDDAEFHTLDDNQDGVPDFGDSGEENRSYSGAWSQGFDLGYLFALEGRSGSNARPNSSANPPPADWSTPNRKIRGPTWDLLRSHYRLYKDRPEPGAGGALLARPFLPTPWADADNPGSRHETPILTYVTTKEYDARNAEEITDFYAYSSPNLEVRVLRPTSTHLAPQLIRVMTVFSLARESTGPANGNVRLIANTMLVVANPYDVPVEFRGFKTAFNQLPFKHISFRRVDAVNGDTTLRIDDMYDWLRQLTNQEARPDLAMNVIATADGTTSPGGRMRLEPGQAVVFSNEGTPVQYGQGTADGIGLPSGPFYEEDSGIYFPRFGENSLTNLALSDAGRLWTEVELKGGWRLHQYLTPDNLSGGSNSWGKGHQEDGPLRNLVIPVGEVDGASPGQERVVGGLSGDYLTGAELGTSLDDRVPLFVMDARLKPFTDDAALLTTANPRALIDEGRFLNGENVAWEAELTPISSFNEIDLDIDIGAGDNSAYWGSGHRASNGRKEVNLFEVPAGPLLSLGDLSQAGIGNFNHDPAYALGNSYTHPLIARNELHAYLDPPGTRDNFSAIDLSYLGNEALWDGYYFSTLVARDDLGESLSDSIDAFLDGRPPPNAGLRPLPDPRAGAARIRADLQNHMSAAAHLLREGAFNVNSTSLNAWRAVLGGIRDRDIKRLEGATLSDTPVDGVYFSRLGYPRGDADDLYQGFHDLTDAQIEALATELVQEVKTRGPFLGLSDFVNRRLETGDAGLAGPLQAAIDRSGINNRMPSVSPAAGDFPHPDNQPPRAAAGLTGNLLQSDVLRLIGHRLAARSDTFLVRAYGDARSSETGDPDSRVWCEAVVQRVPTPVDPAEPDMSTATPANYEPAPDSVFGRRFEILSIRYLNENEI